MKMLAKYLILVLVPAITYASITIKIKPTKDGNDTTVDFFGEDLAEITDSDREFFKIDDETLEQASEKFMGKRCSSVYVKQPTPWGDVYKQFGWDVIRRNIKPIRAKVTGVTLKLVAIGAIEYANSHNRNVVYNISLTQQADETVSHTWSQGGKLGVGKEINYEVNFGVASVGINTPLSYTASWGEDTSKSRTITLGTTSTTQTVVSPGNTVVASLIAAQQTVEIEIGYSIHLKGTVFCNYDEPYQGHHFYSLPIRQLQYTVHSPLVQYTTEKISVSLYSSVRLELTNNISSP